MEKSGSQRQGKLTIERHTGVTEAEVDNFRQQAIIFLSLDGFKKQGANRIRQAVEEAKNNLQTEGMGRFTEVTLVDFSFPLKAQVMVFPDGTREKYSRHNKEYEIDYYKSEQIVRIRKGFPERNNFAPKNGHLKEMRQQSRRRPVSVYTA